MFTSKRRHGASHHKVIRIAASAGALALGAGLALVAPLTANAVPVTASFAQGQFLSGSIAGTDLAGVVALAPAEASNNGSQNLQTSRDPLDATVLQAVELKAPGGVQLDLGDFLDAGVVNQYAQAAKDGSSLGASGAIGDDGAIGVGAVGTGAAGNLTLDLESLLGSGFASSLADLKLELGAVAAQATAHLGTASGDYTLADAHLKFTSPAIANLTNKVNTALEGINGQLLNLGGSDGILAQDVGSSLDPILGGLASADVSVSIDANLQAAISDLLTSQYGDGSVSFNLETGEVTIDLAALLGGNLNDLPVGTELLSAPVINDVLEGVTHTVSTLADQILARVRTAVSNATVTIHAGLNVLTSQGTASNLVCTDQQVPVQGDPITNLLGIVIGHVTKIVTQSVCNTVQSALPDLQTTVDVNIVGTIQQFLDKVGVSATANISLLGVPVALDVNAVVGGLSASILDSLFDSDGAVTQLTQSLLTNLVDPATTGLLGDSSVKTALSDIISVKVNNHDLGQHGPGSFTETAVRVSVLGGLGGGGLATINLAAATVGPNVTSVTDPNCTTNCGGGTDPNCTTNCGGGTDPNCTVNCGTGGNNPPSTTTGSASGRMAMTGINIAAFVALLLALLAAGVFLMREGYRRNHAKATV